MIVKAALPKYLTLQKIRLYTYFFRDGLLISSVALLIDTNYYEHRSIILERSRIRTIRQ